MLFNFVQISGILLGFHLKWPKMVLDLLDYLRDVISISLPEVLQHGQSALLVRPYLATRGFSDCV